jgi:hypothetical protein
MNLSKTSEVDLVGIFAWKNLIKLELILKLNKQIFLKIEKVKPYEVSIFNYLPIQKIRFLAA